MEFVRFERHNYAWHCTACAILSGVCATFLNANSGPVCRVFFLKCHLPVYQTPRRVTVGLSRSRVSVKSAYL